MTRNPGSFVGRGGPEPGPRKPSLLVNGPKLGHCQPCLVNLMRVLRHVKGQLRAAQGCLLMGSGKNSECSGLETQLAFGEVISRR
jgi:hypothetical protein